MIDDVGEEQALMIRPIILSLALPVVALFMSPVLMRAIEGPTANCLQEEDAPPSHQASVQLWSGDVSNDGQKGLAVVFRGSVKVPAAEWLRLQFDEILLAGDPAG